MDIHKKTGLSRSRHRNTARMETKSQIRFYFIHRVNDVLLIPSNKRIVRVVKQSMANEPMAYTLDSHLIHMYQWHEITKAITSLFDYVIPNILK